MLRAALTFLLLTIAGASLAQDFAFDAVRPVGPDGESAPVLGDPTYGLRANFRVFAATGPFRVRFQIADKVGYSTVPGAGRWEHRWQVSMPLDGVIPYRVTLDPDSPGSKERTFAGTFTPRPPAKAIEYYDPRTLAATETLVTRFSQVGDLRDLTAVFGVPQTATSQAVLNLVPPEGAISIQTLPFGAPALLAKLATVPKTLTQTLSFRLQASNVRINADLIRDDWHSIGLVPREVRLYTASEAKIQSDDPKVAEYARANLPADYRASLTPIQAARRLFCAVERDVAYQCPAPPDALSVLASGHGDCGGFSRLYAACLRSIGIPARTVCGWLKGDDVWHCWSEMYLPSAGWIPQDVTAGKARCPDGSYAYCFGTMPDLNERASVSRAETNHVGTAWVDGDLQQPLQWNYYAGRTIPKFTAERHATLKEVKNG